MGLDGLVLSLVAVGGWWWLEVIFVIFSLCPFADLVLLCWQIDIMSKLRHPNINMFMAACLEPKHMCIVTQYEERGSLWSILHDSEYGPCLLPLLTRETRGVGVVWGAIHVCVGNLYVCVGNMFVSILFEIFVFRQRVWWLVRPNLGR